MAQFTQVGRPKQFVTTTPTLTITDIMDAEISLDRELHEHFGGSNRFPRYTIGNDNTQIKFTTSDFAAVTNLTKGLEVTAAQLTFEAPVTGIAVDGTITQASGTIGLTISTARVIEVVAVKNTATGEPAAYEITLRAAIKESDGTAPTLTVDVTPGA